jgi:hypothetical protein
MHLDLPKIVLLLAGALIVAGVALHGVGWSEFQRIWAHMIDRPGGSMALRFILQPAMSSLFALRDGIKDARTGRSPYFWTVLSDPDKRKARLREGLAATGKIILIAVVLDGIYQYIAYKTFFPVEALLVAILLAFVPYLLLRGAFARIAHWWMNRRSSGAVS